MATNTTGTAYQWTTGNPNQQTTRTGTFAPAPPPVQPKNRAWTDAVSGAMLAWTDAVSGGNNAWSQASQ